MRVLIAHPERAVRGNVARWLTPSGYAVDDVAAAHGVREAVRRKHYDVALVATQLCGGDVATLVTDIKRGREGHRTEVLVIERALEYDAALSRLRAGAHDFLVEPLNAAEVLARVRAAARVGSLQAELLAQTRRLETLVFQDALTGLYNRRFMLVQLGALISGARRHGRPVSIVMLDLDHFKAVNDTYGHSAGDALLAAVGRAVRDRLRAEDYAGRMGGEEFLALLPDTDELAAGRVAESLRSCVGDVAIRSASGETVSATASVGWATWAQESADELVRRADRALYAAKDAGRDLVRGG